MDAGAPKITLDQESFKALASDVRVEILKRLDIRRETVTDLSNVISLSKPTLLEHLEKLQAAGLIKRIDEGRKWIYYELSDKGRKILHPERVAITLALASAVVLAFIGAAYLLFAGNSIGAAPAAPGTNVSLGETRGPSTLQSISSGGWIGVAALVFSLIALGIAIALRVYGRRRRGRFFAALGTA
jgi:DNA-binding transcriptional ArsR family regulator